MVTVASLNPDYTVVAVSEPENVPSYHKRAALLRRKVAPYAGNYSINLQKLINDKVIGLNTDTLILGGRSKGGRISTEIAKQSCSPDIDALVIGDVPGAVSRSSLRLAYDIVIGENRKKYKGPTLEGIDELEESKIDNLDIPPSSSVKIGKLVGDFWIGRALSSSGLHQGLDKAMDRHKDMTLAHFHGRGNLGIPIDPTRQMMLHLMQKYPESIQYLESDTRHFSEGHAPRFARQLAWTVDQLKQDN